MPIGIKILHWGPRKALETIAQYPETKDLHLTGRDLMHLLNLHGFEEKSNMITLSVKNINILSYYTGIKTNYYIVLILNLLEDIHNYEEKFKDIALEIIENLEDARYISMLEILFDKIKF